MQEVIQVGWVKWDGDEFHDFRYAAPADWPETILADGYVPVYADAAQVPGA